MYIDSGKLISKRNSKQKGWNYKVKMDSLYVYSRVIYFLKIFEFRNLQLMRGGPTYMHCIFEEKTKIELEMVDREAGQFWCRLL